MFNVYLYLPRYWHSSIRSTYTYGNLNMKYFSVPALRRVAIVLPASISTT